jgi:hypothetical protein
MKIRATITTLLCAAAFPALAAPSPVEVRFSDPTHFTDLRYTTSDDERDAARLADYLRIYLERRAPAHLPPGKRLDVTITDVDMAGELRPSGSSIYMLRRVVRGVYPPRVDLEFKVVGADGTVEREGRRELRNSAFLMGWQGRRYGPLAHEEVLLERWLRTEFPR